MVMRKAARVLLLCLLAGSALAQSNLETARQAVLDWQAGKYRVDPAQAIGKPTEEAIRLLERSLAFPDPPRDLSINLDEPLEETTPRGSVVAFPATAGGRGGEVRVTLREGQVTRIGFTPEGGLLPLWLKNPLSWALFVALSLGWLLALRGNNLLSRSWVEGWALVRQHRGLYLGTNLGLYGLFALGSLVAYANPGLVRLMQELVGGALEQIGLGGALGGGVLSLAVVIFYWNLANGLLLTTAVPALLLGIPALLFNALRYFVLGFALSPVALPTLNYLLHLPTIVIELQAYILVTFGGLVLLVKTLRGEGYRAGLRALGQTAYLGTFFLLVGAWYEAFSILVLMQP
ncbi:MAG: stage II sporulation protein M [Meiothermus sp.]|uniref:stage II sporulation protein M n=2 Tax=Meiothermus sp. TaxID=1955249 RepID=UPI00298EF077|nr:stage II sporulation protein M [Meiothermus sp.]MCS7194654.1 stage II sporulation protein M [Meiothermus sp.]MDW8090937.1 stage II sporulation protein M [Meiothermus sp.]